MLVSICYHYRKCCFCSHYYYYRYRYHRSGICFRGMIGIVSLSAIVHIRMAHCDWHRVQYHEVDHDYRSVRP